MAIDERFAYETFRPGQRELAQRVYNACLDGGTLIVEAPASCEKADALMA